MNRKYSYDEQEGIFVLESEISINWLVSQVLQQPNSQITKITDEQLFKLLNLLGTSDLRMPDGRHGLFWLRDQIKEKMQLSEAKPGQAWYDISQRYRYILEKIDHCVVENKLKDEIVKQEEQKIVNREPNNITASFEPKGNV